MSDPKFKINDPVEFYDDEELILGCVIDISQQGRKRWYKVRTQLDEIAFVEESDLDRSYA